jgi:fumarylacetoacetase
MTGMKFEQGNNFFFSPIGYTGRTSSLLPSGTPIRRPRGVFKTPETGKPAYQPTRKMDYELEMAIFLSKPLPYGHIIDADQATEEHIFGFVLMNDWSVRDVQMYESVPVGPMNSKAFATTISPWVVMPEALQAFRAKPYRQEQGEVPEQMSHLSLEGTTYNIACSAYLKRLEAEKEVRLSLSNVMHMFYSPGQLIAHRASSGCGLVTGELIGMGTVSSPEAVWPDKNYSRAGCLFEMTWDGKRELNHVGGTWLEDGDEVRLEAWASGAGGVRIGFGAVTGIILPAGLLNGESK